MSSNYEDALKRGGVIAEMLLAARNSALEDAAKIAETLANKRVEAESKRGFGPSTATNVANAYWCEEIAAAIREKIK